MKKKKLVILMIIILLIIVVSGCNNNTDVEKEYKEYLDYSLGNYEVDYHYETTYYGDLPAGKHRVYSFKYNNYYGEKMTFEVDTDNIIDSDIEDHVADILMESFKKEIVDKNIIKLKPYMHNNDNFYSNGIILTSGDIRKISEQISYTNLNNGVKFNELTINNVSNYNLKIKASFIRITIDNPVLLYPNIDTDLENIFKEIYNNCDHSISYEFYVEYKNRNGNDNWYTYDVSYDNNNNKIIIDRYPKESNLLIPGLVYEQLECNSDFATVNYIFTNNELVRSTNNYKYDHELIEKFDKYYNIDIDPNSFNSWTGISMKDNYKIAKEKGIDYWVNYYSKLFNEYTHGTCSINNNIDISNY